MCTLLCLVFATAVVLATAHDLDIISLGWTHGGVLLYENQAADR